MNTHQQQKLEQLRRELVVRGAMEQLPIRGESGGYVFTEVDGVTVLIANRSSNPRGGYKVPSVRKYTEVRQPTNLDAAVEAGRHFKSQQKKDDADTITARSWGTGHLGPIVKLDWRCKNRECPCQGETTDQLTRRNGVSLSSLKAA
jgi:hypothetical protein